MKYFRVSKADGQRTEITRERAYELMDGSYRNIDEILDIETTIPLMFCYIEVVGE